MRRAGCIERCLSRSTEARRRNTSSLKRIYLRSNPGVLSDSLSFFFLRKVLTRATETCLVRLKTHKVVVFQAGENPVQGIPGPSKKVRLTWLAWGVQGWRQP